MAPLAQQPVNLKRRREEDDDVNIYPIFVGEQREKLIELRRETWKYRPYLGMDRMYAIHNEEDAVGAEALECGYDPYTMVCEHWLRAIETGKKFEARSLAMNKAWMYALQAISAGHVNPNDVKHYIELASEYENQGIDRSIEALGMLPRSSLLQWPRIALLACARRRRAFARREKIGLNK